MSKPNSSASGKQATLFGFFKKQLPKNEAAAAAARQPPRTPVTPETSVSSNAGSSSADRWNGSSSLQPSRGGETRAQPRASKGGTARSPEGTAPIDLDLDEDDEDSDERQASATTPSAHSKKSANGDSSVADRKGTSSLLAPTPPLTSENEGSSSALGSEMDVDGDEDEEEQKPARRLARTSSANKRQIVLSDEDHSASEDDYSPPVKKAKASKNAASRGKGKGKTKKSDDDSDFSLEESGSEEFDDGGIDWEAAADLSEASASSTSDKLAKFSSNKPAKSTASASDSKSQAADKALLKKLKARYDDSQVNTDGKDSDSFAFLREDRIRDANGKRPGDPDYDERTLLIPKKDYNNFTPFEKQFWDIKKNHMDTVLFFQKGKFFELYEGDADIANQVFDLKLTDRVKMRMAGVPEASIDYWIAKFLGQGYKVGRVDQAETALGADLRRQDEFKSGKKIKAEEDKGPKIVQRELKEVLTTGTIVDGALLTNDLSNHCIAIKEHIPEGLDENGEPFMPRFGLVIADCSTAEFRIAAFEDDACRTKLETTIRQHKPQELVYIKDNLSVPTLRLLRACVGPSCTWNSLRADTKELAPAEAIKGLEELYGGEDDEMELDGDARSGTSVGVPQVIKDMYTNLEAMAAVGCMLWYLKGLNLDKDLFNVRNFNIFDPIRDGKSLVLDGQTLAHIEILQNSLGTDEGTLFRLMCRCNTPFGKRLFKIWVCQPLLEAQAINDRLDAVEDIMARSSNSTSAFEVTFDRMTKKMPDLERLLSRIHAQSCKVKDFLKVLDSLKSLPDMFDKLAEAASEFHSSVIATTLKTVPEIRPLIEQIQTLFSVDGDELFPKPGADEEYDTYTEDVANTEKALRLKLKAYRKQFNNDNINYKDIGTKDIYQIEMPVKVKAPSSWTKISGTKDVNRYYNQEVEKLIKDLKTFRERRDQAVKGFTARVYEAFSRDYKAYMHAVRVVAELDCLVSLAKTSAALGEPAVRPEIVESGRAFIEFEELRHPCVFSATSDFIPNDVKIGRETPNMVLLTGPNMAGKSTLLRMTCVGVIMAQIGCFVPAKSARISPCDKIVSRMGASDNMLAGQSTFRVEMEDCRKILVESTPKTLVILDELGRGTSTHDGLSIAYSVLHQLAGHLGCIGFFATHFTSLVDDFASHPEVILKHMKTFVEEETREVTFLYRLTDGCSPKSYGPHVASMAGVPRSIVERAITVSKSFEDKAKAREAAQRQNQALPLDIQADASYLMKLAAQEEVPLDPLLLSNLAIIRKKIKAVL